MARITTLIRAYLRGSQRFWQCELSCGHTQWVHGMQAVQGRHITCRDCDDIAVARDMMKADTRQGSLEL